MGLPAAAAATLQGIVRLQWDVCKEPGIVPDTRHSNRQRLNELLTTLCPLCQLQNKTPEQDAAGSPQSNLVPIAPSHSLQPHKHVLFQEASLTLTTRELSLPPTLQSLSITDHNRILPEPSLGSFCLPHQTRSLSSQNLAAPHPIPCPLSPWSQTFSIHI